jgi:hypothetical protein
MTGAYEFVCAKASTRELHARLQELGPWDWRIGDSHWYGDYLACTPFSGVRLRICDFPTLVENEWKYQADVRRIGVCQTPMAVIDEAFRKLLAQIPAHSVKEIEWFD